jgi:tagatose-1,6-bisphosphate aldolase non-catalytic subunit AgaZ/GatZ
MTAVTRWPLAIVAGLLLAACARVPSGPGIAALQGSAKTADEFRADDAVCRQAAATEAKATEKWRYDMTYLQCMYAKGNQIPVPGGIFEPTYVSPALSAPGAASAPTAASESQPAK